MTSEAEGYAISRGVQATKSLCPRFGTTVYLLLLVVLLCGCRSAARESSQTGALQAQVPTVQEQTSNHPGRRAGPADPTLNITQQEYENALAKWQSYGVVEYEITFADSTYMGRGGNVKLRFKINRGKPTLVAYTDLNKDKPQVVPLTTLVKDDLEFLRGRSVEEMFRLIGMLFKEQPPTSLAFGNDYEVAFDSTLGYPLHVHSRVFTSQQTSVTDCCISYEVLSLRIIERSTPGMPKTGYLNP